MQDLRAHGAAAAMNDLDAAWAVAAAVCDPSLLLVVMATVDAALRPTGGVAPNMAAQVAPDVASIDQHEVHLQTSRAVAAVIAQMLVDVSNVDHDTVATADALLAQGALADLVTASYIYEARTRLELMSQALLCPPVRS